MRSDPSPTPPPPSIGLPLRPPHEPGWTLIERGFNLAREHEIESLFAIANGYIGTRGSLAEGSALSAPATFIAGVFDIWPESSELPALAVAPDWLRLRIRVAGHALTLEDGETLEHRRILDLRHGATWREWRHRDANGRITRVVALRLASLADRHLLLQTVLLTPENYGGRVTLEPRIEYPPAAQPILPEPPTLRPAPHASDGPPHDGPSAPPTSETPPALPIDPDAAPVLVLRTAATGITVAIASTSRLEPPGSGAVRSVERSAARLVEHHAVDVEPGKTYRLDRLVAVYTSRDRPDPAAAAARYLAEAERRGADALIEAHARAWRARWRDADVEIRGDDDAQRAIRFACYHLIAASNPDDERVSVPARMLSGPAYRGHVFWDTEIYMLPFYLYTHPQAARALLLYRYHTLPAARAKAKRLGYDGAFYAWESADTGDEVTPRYVMGPNGEVIEILTGELEVHISADIAYAVWHYWQATGDDAFFLEAGAEIILETARFWASRGRLEADGRYHIRNVIGPDEYHEGVDDNAYTNGMARWNLERGVETARLLAERWPRRSRELARAIGLGEDEPARWAELAAAMYTGLDPKTGVIEQFQGYHDLDEIDLDAYEPRTAPIDVILGRERVRRSQAIKQPDVLMLIHLLWNAFPPEVREANFRHYDPRTAHGSSLSPSIHALLAARLGETALARRYWRQAAEIDLADNMGNAAGGVHAAALGGLWQATVFGFAGLETRGDRIRLDPHLPGEWAGLGFAFQWRGRRLRAEIGPDGARWAEDRGGSRGPWQSANG